MPSHTVLQGGSYVRLDAPAGVTRADAQAALISPRRVAQFSAVLWGIGCAVGVLAIALPHGPTVNLDSWAILTLFAGAVALWMFLGGERQPGWLGYLLSALALMGVTLAVVSARHSPVVFAVASLYTLSAIYSAAFYPPGAFVAFQIAQVGLCGLALTATGVPGALAGWAVVSGTTTTVGVVVHLLQHALRTTASTDPLTGLVNRRALEPTIGRELTRCARLGHPLCLAVVDLDHFKEVNDEQGHPAGDRVLAGVSRAWSEVIRAEDVLSRAGGDEFVLLLPSTGTDEAVGVLARMSQVVDQPFSAGVARATPLCTVEELLHHADQACYRAKRNGGARVVVAGRAVA